jgi:2,3-bisphosphoglycerate-independent phosphoglycerate mutase
MEMIEMKKVFLCILDGVGVSEKLEGNAYANAKKPFLDELINKYPHSLLDASGEAVGLPSGQMGNSEVGHTNIGAGRIVYQPLGLINSKIKDKTFFENTNILKVIKNVKSNNKKLHIMGLLSDGGIHSHINHLMALIDMCKANDITKVYFHIFMDGRDTSPYVGNKYIEELERKIKEVGIGSISTVSGRYYAMDRDNNYDRLKVAYDAIVNGIGEEYNSALDCWQYNQDNGITDEFIVPAVIDKNGMIESDDSVIVFNFRPDRVREIGSSLTNPNFNGFDNSNLKGVEMVTMMPVSEEVVTSNAFRLEDLINTVGEYLSMKGLSQLRIAETEKYAHVTYFFDGGVEKYLANCQRILIPSPKVATYDLKPEMSAYEITDSLIDKLKIEHPDLIVLNFANGDMVGHTGNYEAAVKAIETIDECLKKIFTNLNLDEYTPIITADHGNCEVMINEDGSINTQHSTNKVNFIVCDKNLTVKDGKLGDIACSILNIMDIDIPKEMTGENLINK